MKIMTLYSKLKKAQDLKLRDFDKSSDGLARNLEFHFLHMI